MAIYGLQADVDSNPGRNVVLYVPGKTVLTPQDVFLGGSGTGVTDQQLNGAQRVYGNDAKGTSIGLDEYNGDLASQIKAAIAANAAPRPDSYMGMPSMDRQKLELQQAQSAIENAQNQGQLMGFYNGKATLDEKKYEHGVAQDAFNNGISVGQLMGVYGGQDTLAKQAQSIQDAQFNAQLGQDESRFSRKLASDNANASADRYLKQNSMSASDVQRMNTSSAYADVQKALDAGTSPDDVKRNIMSRAADYQLNGISPTQLVSFVDSLVKTWGDSGINPNITRSHADSAMNSLLK